MHGVPLADDDAREGAGHRHRHVRRRRRPAWDKLPFAAKPERGLLALRKELDLFANLRPAMVFPALADASSLKRELVEGLDIMILRELTGGVYFGEPRGVETCPDGSKRGVDTQVYTTPEIERIARRRLRAGAQAAATGSPRSRRPTSCTRACSGARRCRRCTTASIPDVELDHMYADNCAMQLVRQPKQFDVIVTDNLFGDILSDCAAMLTGSLGMLPSASLGAADAHGRRKAMYEPVHGSAPDIAGQGIANPIACLLSFAMLLRYSFDLGEEADRLEQAIGRVLEQGYRTADIAGPGRRQGLDLRHGRCGPQGARPLARLTGRQRRRGLGLAAPLAEDRRTGRGQHLVGERVAFGGAGHGHGTDHGGDRGQRRFASAVFGSAGHEARNMRGECLQRTGEGGADRAVAPRRHRLPAPQTGSRRHDRCNGWQTDTG